jgi:hypothetical protein
MKKLMTFAVILSLGAFSLGCRTDDVTVDPAPAPAPAPGPTYDDPAMDPAPGTVDTDPGFDTTPGTDPGLDDSL